MLQFLQPILLFSIGAIAIPVIVHLWNVKQGKTLKVGSIALLLAGSRENARSLKLHDLLLLFLRCLLVGLLACLIAKPLWQQAIVPPKEKGWLLLEQGDLNNAYTKNKTSIDSLIKTGFELHYLQPDFPKDDLLQALKTQHDGAPISNTQSPARTNLPYGSLLKELNEVVPADLPVVVFVQNNINRFSGARPAVSLNVQIHTYLSDDTASHWIDKAFLAASDSIHLVVGHSKPTGTSYTINNIATTSLASADYTVQIVNGRLMVALRPGSAGTDTSLVEVDTSVIRVALYTDKYGNDLSYLSAALETIRRFSKRKMNVLITRNYQEIQGRQDWLFWLSEQPVPASVAAKNTFQYEKGKAEDVRSWIATANETVADKQPIYLAKSIIRKAGNDVSESVWSDGYGMPILSKEEKDDKTVYHFYSRLDPEWNDLPWLDEFPKLILQLLLHDNEHTFNAHDKRMLDEKQVRPVIVASKEAVTKDKFTQQVDLTRFVWAAAFIVFFIERWLAIKTKNAVTNG